MTGASVAHDPMALNWCDLMGSFHGKLWHDTFCESFDLEAVLILLDPHKSWLFNLSKDVLDGPDEVRLVRHTCFNWQNNTNRNWVSQNCVRRPVWMRIPSSLGNNAGGMLWACPIEDTEDSPRSAFKYPLPEVHRSLPHDWDWGGWKKTIQPSWGWIFNT